MHSSFFITLLAGLALSKPLDKRYYVTVTDIVTVVTTITEETGSVQTVVAEVPQTHSFHHQSWTSSVVVTSSSTPVPAPAPAPAPTTESSTEIAPTITSSASSAPAASSTADSSYESILITQHNIHRANHSAPDVVWSDSLAAIAQSIGETCVYAHNVTAGGGGYGQNIGAGAEPSDVGAMITNEMYNGEINAYPLPYGNNNPSMANFASWGHFSQIVWKDTTSVGCATVKCATLSGVSSDVEPYFTVCNYSPPGNFGGEYSNVGAPLGEAAVTV